jgi:fatty-acyl-CoA synthase
MLSDSVGAALERSLALYPEHPAIEFDDRTLTYGDVERWSGALAEMFLSLGLGPGSRVAVLADNCPEFIITTVATARVGAAKVPVNPVLPQDTIRYALDLSDTDVLVVGPEFVEKAAGAVEGLDRVRLIQFGDAVRLNGAAEFPTLQASVTSTFVVGARAPADAPAAVQFTGGTTGRPKGVLHTQAALMSYHVAQIAEAEIRRQERMLLMTPLAHAAGNLAETALIRGATVVLHRGFSVPDAGRAIRENGISWTFLVPTMLYRLLDQWPEEENSSDLALDTIVYGAAPMSPRRLEEAIARFGLVFIQLYGQTECPNWGTRLAKADHDLARPERLASCGQASLMVDVKVVDDDGHEVAPGETGEICLRAPYVLSEYVKNPEATAEKFLGGFIRTGDIGVMQPDRFVYLKDRKGDMIITGGMNVYSREVEDVLQAHHAVSAAAVVGLPDDDWGEAVVAVLTATEPIGADELKAWCRDKLANYAIPKRFEIVRRIPETPYGKVDKVALREQLQPARESSAPA